MMSTAHHLLSTCTVPPRTDRPTQGGGKSIWGAYWMTFEGGLNVRQFVKMLRNFSGAFTAGISIYREEAPQPKLTLVEPPM